MLCFMMIPDEAQLYAGTWDLPLAWGSFPQCLAEPEPDCWWPQSFWAVTGDQILSLNLRQEGTACRSASCRVSAWSLRAAVSWEWRQGRGPRSPLLPPVPDDVTAPWDPSSLGCRQQAMGQRGPRRKRKGRLAEVTRVGLPASQVAWGCKGRSATRLMRRLLWPGLGRLRQTH